jgi:hypothetical protein
LGDLLRGQMPYVQPVSLHGPRFTTRQSPASRAAYQDIG